MENAGGKRRRVTIKDIARETGFTAQTVSLALRNKECITQKTRDEVIKAARKLGYVQNELAVSLRSGHTNTIAVVYDNISNPYFSYMTHYLQYYFRQRGYVLLIFAVDSYFLDPETFYSILSYNVAGVISFLDVDDTIASLSKEYDLPVVVLGRKSGTNVSWIATAESKGGALAAEYLMSKGCRSNLHITYSLDMICGRERYGGFLGAIQKASLRDDLLLVLDRRPLNTVLTDYLAEHEVDGIFAFNDMLAYSAISILKEMGRNEVKVVGFDNVQEMLHFPVRINTIGAEKVEMVKMAVDVLLGKIDKSDERVVHEIFDVYISTEDGNSD